MLVLGNPHAPHLKPLDTLKALVNIEIGIDLDWAKQRAPAADAIFVANFAREPFQAIFPLATKVRWVHAVSAGVDYMLTPEFVLSAVPLTNGRGAFKDSLAEYAITAMLFFAKDLRTLLRNQQAQNWAPFDMAMLRGQTLGIVGYGEIGRATAQLAAGLGMRVIAVRRRPNLSNSDPTLASTYAPDRLKEMLAECDFVLVAAPLTPETRGLIGAPEFAVMKRTSVIMNVGRGPVIVESALIEALETAQIRGAALDVFDQEPLAAGHPFYKMENVLLSPHCADHIPGWLELAVDVFLENTRRFVKGEPLRNIVDKQAGY
ncbi:MAG TPA: D-2-hydroxyacid dehydrogenase [Bryobacteraceae bacterium]|nr:D-2-hydroxyacid dehydrogenase [Bryobacteraceae bacterium]